MCILKENLANNILQKNIRKQYNANHDKGQMAIRADEGAEQLIALAL